MSGYRLDNTRARTAHLKSTPSHSLLSVLDSSPEPTTTASGVAPGRALFDDRSPSPEAVSEPEGSTRRYSQRVRISTEKIKPHNEEIAEKKRKRRNRKPRRKISTSSFASEQSTTTNYASDTDASQPSHVGHIVAGQPASAEGSVGGTPVADIHRTRHHKDVLPAASTSGLPPLHAGRVEAPGADHDPTDDGPTSNTAEPNASTRRPDNAQPSAATRRPNRPGPERDADYWDFSADHEGLETDLRRLVEANPEELSQISPDNLKAIIEVLEKDRSRRRSAQQTGEVLAPRLQAEVQPIASNAGLEVGGGHHLNQQHPKLPGSFYQPDTEPESDPDIQILKHTPRNRPTNPTRQSSSPSPLPTSSVPIDPNIRHLLDLPINHPRGPSAATQTSTQSRPRHTAAGLKPRPISHLPTRLSSTSQPQSSQPQSQSTRQWESTGSMSLGDPIAISRDSSQLVSLSSSSGRPPPRKTARTSRHGDPLTPSRPFGTASQESRRAHRASHPAPRIPEPPKIPKKYRLSAEAIQAMNLARARYRLRRERERRAKTGTGSTDTSRDLTRMPSPPDLMEDDEEERAVIQAESSGRDPYRGRKPKPAARNIHGNERHNLAVSKPHLYAYSVVEGAWQTRALVSAWAPEIYAVTWEQEFPNLPFEAPSFETLQVMINSQPSYRGRVKEALRPLIEFWFGFKKPAITADAISHNQALYRQLHPNRFHCLQLVPPYGPYESDFVHQALAVSLFYGPTAPATSFRNYYQPMPETAVAFVLANVQFCLEEYDTGRHQARDLNASDMLNKYVAHLRGLKVARRTAKKRFARLAQEWFDYGIYSGVMELDDPFTQPITLAEDVRPDSPSSDEANEGDYLPEGEPAEQSEDEPAEEAPETDENGRFTTRAKGKSRA
ncbi:hypothetical protein FRC12_014431 [Ceratobasidium sp. 428]|nr:hypothetical protein FRC12_014431 [Ceratobasidium sp. 428]